MDVERPTTDHPAPTTTRVVVAYDGSTSSRAALAAGVEQALRHGVPLLLVNAVEVGDPVWSPAFCRSAADMLRDAASRCRAGQPGLEVSTLAVLGPPTPVVLEQARPHDLLVVGTRGHRPVARVLLGSTATSLVTHAQQPVLVARAARVTPDAPVVVGVDGSPSSGAAVRAAAHEAHRAGVRLVALTAVPPVTDPMGLVVGSDAAEVAAAHRLLAAVSRDQQERFPGLVVEPVVTRTHPVEALVHASRRARVVVLGSRGRGTLRSVLLGSVSRSVVQHAAGSVLVIRPAGVPAPGGRTAAVAAAGG